MKAFTLTVLLFLFIGNCVSQQYPPAPASPSPDHDHATVYVYRLDSGLVVANVFLWFQKTRPVYFSELSSGGAPGKKRTIAALRNQQYFMLKLPAGKYVFDTRMMWGDLELEVVPGGEYYLLVDQGYDCPSEDPSYPVGTSCESRSASVMSVPRDQWDEARSVLQPISKRDVKDEKLIVIPPGPHRTTASTVPQ